MTKRISSQHPSEKESSLRTLRETAGLTQDQLAFHLQVASSTVRRWEKGTEPSLSVLQMKKFCQLVGKSLEELPDYLGKPLNTDGTN